MVEVVQPCELRFILNFTRTTLASGHVSLLVTTVCGQDDDILCIQLSQSSSGVSGYAGTPSSPAVEAHTEHRVLSLTLDDRPNVPPPPDPGDLAGKYGAPAVLQVIPRGSNSADGQNPPPGDSTLGTLSQDRSPWSESKRPVERPGNSTLGTLLKDSSPRSESKRPVERPSSCDTGHNAWLATKGLVQQSPVNRPVYSEHGRSHRDPVNPVTVH